MEFLKKDTSEFISKQKQTYRLKKKNKKKPYSYQRESMAVVGRVKSGGWDERIYTIICKIGNQQGPIAQGTNSTQHSVITYKRKESENLSICMCITESLNT